MHRPAPREPNNKQNGQIILSSSLATSPDALQTSLDGKSFVRPSSSCENLTLYGAACVSKV